MTDYKATANAARARVEALLHAADCGHAAWAARRAVKALLGS